MVRRPAADLGGPRCGPPLCRCGQRDASRLQVGSPCSVGQPWRHGSQVRVWRMASWPVSGSMSVQRRARTSPWHRPSGAKLHRTPLRRRRAAASSRVISACGYGSSGGCWWRGRWRAAPGCAGGGRVGLDGQRGVEGAAHVNGRSRARPGPGQDVGVEPFHVLWGQIAEPDAAHTRSGHALHVGAVGGDRVRAKTGGTRPASHASRQADTVVSGSTVTTPVLRCRSSCVILPATVTGYRPRLTQPSQPTPSARRWIDERPSAALLTAATRIVRRRPRAKGRWLPRGYHSPLCRFRR